MVKGCQKKTIHIKDIGSKYYEEAYFILRPGIGEGGKSEDMIDEAVRIAGESLLCVTPKKRKRALAGKYTVFFLLGALFGGAAASVALALICV